MRALLLYAAFCILEEISYTRKDGQYLRWDARSGRSQGKRPFNKGRILTFREAIFQKLEQIATSLTDETTQEELFHIDTLPEPKDPAHEIELSEGSCLEILPLQAPNSIDFVMTSPPYANRYDYTRTYALELVYLGCNEEKVKHLRQAMLSCTVENKEKRAQLLNQYEYLWGKSMSSARLRMYSTNRQHYKRCWQRLKHTGKMGNSITKISPGSCITTFMKCALSFTNFPAY